MCMGFLTDLEGLRSKWSDVEGGEMNIIIEVRAEVYCDKVTSLGCEYVAWKNCTWTDAWVDAC